MMEDTTSTIVKYQKMVLKIVLIIYSISAVSADGFLVLFRILGIYKQIAWIKLIIFAGVILVELLALWLMYAKTKEPENWKRYFKLLNLLLIAICYVNYIILGLLTPSREIWVIVFYFVILAALFLDKNIVLVSIVMSVLSDIVLFLLDPYLMPDKKVLFTEMGIRAIIICFVSLGIFIFTALASGILKKVDENEKLLKEKNKRISELFNKISQFSSVILSSSDSLTTAIEESNSYIQEIASNSQCISSNGEKILDSSGKSHETLTELLNINENVSSKFINVTDNSSKLMEMSNYNEELLNSLRQVMQDIIKGTKSSYNTILNLEEKSKDIDNIVIAIGDIAEQTNLLALNASIEAARAGESGKGFAVVAEEVRVLAENTRESLSSIGDIINGFKREINEVKTFILENNKQISSGEDIVGSTVEDTMKMIEGLKKTGLSIEEINELIIVLSKETKKVVDFNSKVSEMVSSIIGEFQNVTDAINQTAATSEEIIASSEELKATAAEMNALTD